MLWDILNIIGIPAFAISGAIVALEEKYDLFGLYVLGFVTAFGGGIIRNVLIGVPVTDLWKQGNLMLAALIAMSIVALFPYLWGNRWRKWILFFDAVGLSSFAIQGALFAHKMGHPLYVVIVASVLTGIGGGVIRDLLAGRKPAILRDEIYAIWCIMIGVCVGSGWIASEIGLYTLLVIIVVLRMLSVHYHWNLSIYRNYPSV
ncbi:Uncharacterized membrane protein YeiH [Thermoactinomyces sp. DSM 45891]|uniref:trimeric intracellular cation channel family protein n=1 Tax=Thermoactinomyces sp. DSM 45891 TaxID=1761907 RepID=UPI000921A9FA|nr:trimeric intracellular cation channel family protein [Thermoactinomyces sp. DSM 45891]SFX05243.1 Uncharacterized membrane protein YeiH [Thermoactinomyces sp. DSM 45891]